MAWVACYITGFRIIRNKFTNLIFISFQFIPIGFILIFVYYLLRICNNRFRPCRRFGSKIILVVLRRLCIIALVGLIYRELISQRQKRLWWYRLLNNRSLIVALILSNQYILYGKSITRQLSILFVLMCWSGNR